jgi:glycosyltransferase involved in cell wall biosynthesis
VGVRRAVDVTDLSVQMLGTRGLPNKYGGSETCVEEVGVRLLDRGQEVRIFSRPRVTGTDEREFRGMAQVPLPSVPVQNVDTLSHSLLAVLWLGWRRLRAGGGAPTPVLHFHGSGNGAVTPLTRALNLPTVVTVDGPDWRRAKWGPVARRLLRTAAWLATRCADVVVADSREAVAVYKEDFGADTVFIPYGAPEVADEPAAAFPAALRERGLGPGDYILFVGRFTPEKEIHTLVQAHGLLPEPRPPLVLVGGTPDDSDYARQVAGQAGDGVHFVGKLFGDELDPVARGARVYVQPSAVEGTSPMILTAMAYGLPLIASGIAENRETIGEGGTFFPAGDARALADAIRTLLDDPELARERADALRRRVHATYSWDAVTDAYLRAYRDAVDAARSRRRR